MANTFYSQISANRRNSFFLAGFVIVILGVLGFAIGYGVVILGVPIHRFVILWTVGFTLLTYLAYYIVCESFFGVTIGKLITGTRVVDNEGGRPRFKQIVGRSLARFVPFEQFSFFSTPAIGWHDTWSGTRVVKTR